MWKITLAAAILATGPAFAQTSHNVTVFGNSDAQQCYLQTKLIWGGGSDALDYCNRALKFGGLTRKDKAATLVNRGINFTRTGQHEDALKDFEAALAINSELAEAYLNRGNTFIFKRDFRQALDDYNRAIELGTKDAHAAYYNRGLAYEALSDLDNAYADFVQATFIRPEWEMALERIERYESKGYDRSQL